MHGKGGNGRRIWPYALFIVTLGLTSHLVTSSFFLAVTNGLVEASQFPAYSILFAICVMVWGACLAVCLAKAIGHDMERTEQRADAAERRADEAEHLVVDIANIAYHDSLTHVKSQAAYDEFVHGLEDQIATANGTLKPKFSVVMIDLNNLKQVNDTYGHDVGNEYLVNACKEVSTTFKQSPVFRIGGDEFVVIMTGEDYSHRRQLVGCLEDTVRRSLTTDDMEPWQRCSMAIGMATYYPYKDTCYADVFERADKRMYQNKVEMKERVERNTR